MAKTFPELKIKIRSLAEEAAIIRAEERKHSGERRNAIHNHRVIDVRRAQRATYIAYGYLRGRAYRQIEPQTRCDRPPHDRPGPSWERVRDMVAKYGPAHAGKDAIWQALQKWKEAKPSAVSRDPAKAEPPVA